MKRVVHRPGAPVNRGIGRTKKPACGGDKLTGRQIWRRSPARPPSAEVPLLDYVIRSGTLIDGSGEAPRTADVGLRDGRIVALGEVHEAAATEFDAAGLCVAPGIVDPHTHYDAQLFWDPSASPSNVHGVTTVIGGNCGFTLAPLNAEDADYIRRLKANDERMPLAPLEDRVPWGWAAVSQDPDALDGGGCV